MVAAVQADRELVGLGPFQGFVTGRFGTLGGAETDDEILAAARQAITTIWHPTCTAMMSPANASWGVLDPRLRVKGSQGLRVVDASIFVSVHPFAVCVTYN